MTQKDGSAPEKVTRRVRIVSDGSYPGSRVTLHPSGEEIPRVRAVRVSIGYVEARSYGGEVSIMPGEPARAEIETVSPALDVVADATNDAVCPHCGHRTEGWDES